MREFGCIYAQSSNHGHGKQPATKKSRNTFRHFGTSQESSGANSNHMSGSELNRPGFDGGSRVTDGEWIHTPT